MALSVWQKVITSNTGVAVPNAQVEVFIGDTVSKANLFQDSAGTTPLTNPFDADANGFAQFYVAGGTYRIEASAEGADAVFDDVQLGTAQSLDVGDVVAPGDLATVATTGDHVDLLNKGTNTHAQIDTHIADFEIHRPLDDDATSAFVLWSSSKISTELATKLESVDWGDIGGTLASQTDLNTALGLKANTADLATVATSGDHTDLTNIGTNTHAQIDTHIAGTAEGIHGSTVAETANRLIHRDANGRAKIADPSADADIASKAYVDSVIGAGITVKNSLEIDSAQAQFVNDVSNPPSYSCYGVIAGSRNWERTHKKISSAQEAFKLKADKTVNDGTDDAILFQSTLCSTFGAGNGFIDLGIYSTDYIGVNADHGGAFMVTGFIQKTGTGTVNVNLVSTGTAQIGNGASIELAGAGIFPITFNCFILGTLGGINLAVEHVNGENKITKYSHINVVRTAGSLLS